MLIAALAVEIQENNYIVDEESEKINISQEVSTQVSYIRLFKVILYLTVPNNYIGNIFVCFIKH